MSELALPEGWGYQELDTFLDFALGGDWGKSADYDDPDFETVYCIRGTEISHWADTKGSTAVERKIKSSSLEKRKLKAGDILVEISGGGPDQPVGRTVVIDEKVLRNFDSDNLVCTNFLRLFRPIEEVDSKYLNYYLQMFYNSGYINEYQSGSNNLRNLKFKDFLTINIPYASLNEQKQIVLELERYFQTISQIQARLDAIPKLIEKFRQSVLNDAVSGKLTEEWRDKKNITEWEDKGLSEVGSLSRGKSKHRPRNDPKLYGELYPFIQTGDVANSRSVIKSANKFYSEFGLNQSRLFPKGTLCITIAANIADTALLGIDACFPDSVVGFIPDSNKSNASFIKYFIDVNKQNLERFAPATAQKNINLKVLNSLVVSMPSIEEQYEIVMQVEQLLSYADQIEKSVAIAIARVDNLTQSILYQAFTGQLTKEWREQNPELISGDNSSEALLAKIEAEKKASGKKGKAKK